MGKSKQLYSEMNQPAMEKKVRRAKTSLNSEGLVGVIVKYDLDNTRWEFLGMFDGNKVYKVKEKHKEWDKNNNTNS